jgi:guanylate kinase
MAGKLFIVSACSGAGKTTLVTKVIERLSDRYDIARLVTYTTKQPRLNDEAGKDYHFLSVQEFEEKIKEGFFLEWSSEYGHYYGSPTYLIRDMDLGKSYIVITSLAGAQTLRDLIKEALLIWIYTHNLDVIKNRLFQRNTENYEQIYKRITIAQQEIDNQELLTIFTYTVLNDNLEKALSELECIVEDALKKTG